MNYEELLTQITLSDDKFIILTAENRAAIRNLPKILGNRFIDTGITEQTMVGISAGLALRGRIPITHALASFLTMRAFEFIRTDIGIGQLPVKLVGSFAGFLSEANGPTHQAIEDISLMRGIPKMKIFCPSDENDMIECLPKIFDYNKPVYIRYNNLPALFEHKPFELGQAELVTEGNDLTILSYGMMVREAFIASELLSERGINARLINLRTLKPFDDEIIFKAIFETPVLITIEDHLKKGGLYSILCEFIAKNKLSTDLEGIALKNRWFKPALLKDVLANEGFTGLQLADRIEHYLINKGSIYNERS
ncbi:MAG: transketolase [Ignavibacteria bacterium]|nr:transketolase [Ignavibacteria bacterium]